MKREIKIDLKKTKEENLTHEKIIHRIWKKYEGDLKASAERHGNKNLTENMFSAQMKTYYGVTKDKFGEPSTAEEKKKIWNRAIRAFDMSGWYRTNEERSELHATKEGYFGDDKELMREFQKRTRDYKGRFTKFDYNLIQGLGSYTTVKNETVHIDKYLDFDVYIITYDSPYHKVLMSSAEVKSIIPGFDM